MFVIRSLKTGKTYLRINPDSKRVEWVMSQEEQPTLFAQRSDAARMASELGLNASDHRTVSLSEVPHADNGKPINDELRADGLEGKMQLLVQDKKRHPLEIRVMELEAENTRLRVALQVISETASKAIS